MVEVVKSIEFASENTHWQTHCFDSQILVFVVRSQETICISSSKLMNSVDVKTSCTNNFRIVYVCVLFQRSNMYVYESLSKWFVSYGVKKLDSDHNNRISVSISKNILNSIWVGSQYPIIQSLFIVWLIFLLILTFPKTNSLVKKNSVLPESLRFSYHCLE